MTVNYNVPSFAGRRGSGWRSPSLATRNTLRWLPLPQSKRPSARLESLRARQKEVGEKAGMRRLLACS